MFPRPENGFITILRIYLALVTMGLSLLVWRRRGNKFQIDAYRNNKGIIESNIALLRIRHRDDEAVVSQIRTLETEFARIEEDFSRHWVDSRLVTACKMGYTLVYDEFTRSRPEANNVLLAALEERVLALPNETSYVKVDPRFSAIFTSNPEEYAGVYKSQDALRDRMVTIYLDQYDEETESAITAAKSGLPGKEAKKIVQLVRRIREDDNIPVRPTARASIAIAKILAALNLKTDFSDPYIRAVVIDVISSHINGSEARKSTLESLKKILASTAIRGVS